LTVIHEKEKTTLTFPNGQKKVIQDQHQKLVHLA
jgi:hypothetical protein